MNEQSLSQCFKRVEFVISVGATRRQEVQEKWIYDCEFQVCSQVNLFPINGYTPCACGLTWAMPKKRNDNGPIAAAFDISLHSARAVVYNRVTRREVEVMSEWQFQANAKTTDWLRQIAGADGLKNWTMAVAGFSGTIESFTPPPSLNTNTPGQEDHVPALCFTVLQSYQSDYKWPEPAFPNLHSAPNVYMTDCTPFNPTQGQTPFIYFRDMYLFSDDSAQGSNPIHRYLTSYYRNSRCDPVAGYFTIEREFTSFLRRAEKPGCFRWSRRYIRNWLIGGVPWTFGTVDYYYANGFRNVTYWQGYTRKEQTCEVHELYGVDVTCTPSNDLHNSAPEKGVLFNALKGTTMTSIQAESAGPLTKVCTTVPAAWETCTIGSAATGTCGSNAFTASNFKIDGVYRWPLPSPGVSQAGIDGQFVCDEGVFELCDSDETYMCYQNFGGTDRDFTKGLDSWLVTGERQLFCGIVQDSALDVLKLAPVHQGEIKPVFNLAAQKRRKRHQREFVSEMHDPSSPLFHDELAPLSKRNGPAPRTFIRKRGVLQETPAFVGDPPASGIPQQQPGVTQFSAGSANADGLPGGDHPVNLFPETYALPVSMDPTDTACGSYPGDFITKGCGAKEYNGFPPCIEGTLGCNCRQSSGRPACDLPYVCRGGGSSGGFCVKPPCVAGTPGCACVNGACDDAPNVLCNATIDRCYFDVSKCPVGTPGCPCAESTEQAGVFDRCQGGSAFVCAEGVCKNTDRVNCNAGSGGCMCDSTDPKCDQTHHECSEYGECISSSFCEMGAPGCTCASGGRCSTEMTCDAGMNVCVQPECKRGDKGCPCRDDCKCNDNGYSCEFLFESTGGAETPCDTGAESACLAILKCDRPSAERCINYCGGEANVRRCPPCEFELPQCWSYDAGAHLVPAFGLLVALLVTVFLSL